eukprot:g9429.t1
MFPGRRTLWWLPVSNIFLAHAARGATTTISNVVTTPAPPLAQGDGFAATWTLTTDDAEPLTTGDLTVYTVTLEPCASDTQASCACAQDGNPEAILLCETCVDSNQSYDVEVPRDTPPGVYLIRVSLKSDTSGVFACSAGFRVQEEAVEGASGPGVEVEASSAARRAYVRALEGQSAVPGEAFTAKWFYDNGTEDGEEGAAGDFKVDLYACEGGACADGSCGTFVASLCPDGGCHDPGTGDYDVVVPAYVAPGAFSLYVEELSGEGGVWDCTPFTVSTDPSGKDLLVPVDPVSGATRTASTAAELTGVWLIRTSLAVTNGVTLNLHGAAAGGDCDELKIRSSPSLIHAVRGHGGNLDVYKTLIQSWDEVALVPHQLPADSVGEEPRSYIACSSEVLNENDTCGRGSAREDMGECRMDLIDSELGHMGYEATESYGITWKVRGFCSDMTNPEVFEDVNVYGDITNCDIHHMWYGMYSYGHQGGVWTDNLMHGNHGIIASKRCDHLVVADNKVDASGGSGIMLHRSCDDSIISGNVVTNSADAGISLVETSRVVVKDNVLTDNKWGARYTVGASDNQFFDNVVSGSTQRDIYTYPGADEPLVEPFTGRCTNNVFDSNTYNYVAPGPINLEFSDGTVISNNIWNGEDGFFEFDTSFNTTLVGNTGDIVNSDDHRVDGSSCFTAGSQLDPTCS